MKFEKNAMNHGTRPKSDDFEVRASVIKRTIRGKETLVLSARFEIRGKKKKRERVLNLRPTRRNRLVAARQLEQFEASIRIDLMGPKIGRIPFSGFAKECLEVSMASRLKPNTLRGYRNVIINHLIPYFLDIDIRDITNSMMNELFEILSGRLAKSSVRGMFSGPLGHILGRAESLGYIDTRPKLTVRVRRGSPRTDYFSNDDLKDFFSGCKEIFPSWYPMYYMMVCTGVRVGEVLALRWDDISWDLQTITIARNYNSDFGSFGTPKSGKVRSVPLAGSLCRVLKSWRDDPPTHDIGTSKKTLYLKPGTYLFEPRNPRFQTKLHRTHVERTMVEICKLKGLPIRRPHTLRHTCASLMAQSGKTLTDIKQILGHQSITTTEMYAHLLKPSVALVDAVNWLTED